MGLQGREDGGSRQEDTRTVDTPAVATAGLQHLGVEDARHAAGSSQGDAVSPPPHMVDCLRVSAFQTSG